MAPIQIDAITKKKLILAKQLYHRAAIQSMPPHSTTTKIMSVIGFDLAIETVLRAIVSSLQPSKSPSESFQGLIQQVEELLNSSLPDKANIQHVHSIRNDAQHKAKYPSDSEVSDCRTYTKDFLQKIVHQVWGLSFEKISLTDLIQHQRVKEFLFNAETALNQKDYQQAVRQAAAGLAWALKLVKTALVGYVSDFHRAFVVKGLGEIEEDRDAYRAFLRMQDTLLYTALGMNYADYMRIKGISGEVLFFLDGSFECFHMKENIYADEAEFVVSYCTEAVVQIENQVGDLEAPFGRSRLYWY